MAKFTYFDFFGFVLLGILIFTCVVFGLTIVRDYFTEGYYVKTTCLLEDIRDLGLFKCNVCVESLKDQYKLDEHDPGCIQSSFPCFQIHVRYYNGHMGENVIGIIHSSESHTEQRNKPRCSHYHCSSNLTENKKEVQEFVEVYRSNQDFTCYYDPYDPTGLLTKVNLRWLPVFHCMFWPGLAALIIMSCLCCRLYIWERLPCRKEKQTNKDKSPEKQLYAPAKTLVNSHPSGGKSPTEDDVFSSLPDITEAGMSPAPSFKSVVMSESTPHLHASVPSLYWSYPSLASNSHRASFTTSTASFRTALEQIDDTDEISINKVKNSDDDDDDNVSFSSIPTSKHDLSLHLNSDCDISNVELNNNNNSIPLVKFETPDNSPRNPSETKEDPVWVRRPRNGSPCKPSPEPMSGSSIEKSESNSEMETKENGAPLGIKRFKNVLSPVIIKSDKRNGVKTKTANNISTKDTLNNSF